MDIHQRVEGLAVCGEVWECGVYHGATSVEVARVLARKSTPRFRLFDTFTGRPMLGTYDTSRGGETAATTFDDTSYELVRQKVKEWSFVSLHQGVIPYTFVGLEESVIAFAYLDMDLYQGTYDALVFIRPRLAPGGVIVVDDYLEPEVWPGVRVAVDQLIGPHERTTYDGHRLVIET